MGGGSIAANPYRYQAKPKISEAISKEMLMTESIHQESEELTAMLCIL
jgi:hypothetical protein